MANKKLNKRNKKSKESSAALDSKSSTYHEATVDNDDRIKHSEASRNAKNIDTNEFLCLKSAKGLYPDIKIHIRIADAKYRQEENNY